MNNKYFTPITELPGDSGKSESAAAMVRYARSTSPHKYTNAQTKKSENNEYFQKIMTVEQSYNDLFTPLSQQQQIKKSALHMQSNKYANSFSNKYAPQKSTIIQKSMSSKSIKKSRTPIPNPDPDDAGILSRLAQEVYNALSNPTWDSNSLLNAARQVSTDLGIPLQTVLQRSGVWGPQAGQTLMEAVGQKIYESASPEIRTRTSDRSKIRDIDTSGLSPADKMYVEYLPDSTRDYRVTANQSRIGNAVYNYFTNVLENLIDATPTGTTTSSVTPTGTTISSAIPSRTDNYYQDYFNEQPNSGITNALGRYTYNKFNTRNSLLNSALDWTSGKNILDAFGILYPFLKLRNARSQAGLMFGVKTPKEARKAIDDVLSQTGDNPENLLTTTSRPGKEQLRAINNIIRQSESPDLNFPAILSLNFIWVFLSVPTG